MKKKVVVIGGGIAGLNAGIELLQHGFDVSLYEKNDEVGGLCSGYFVGKYNIDACLHWLMGTKKHTTLNNLWRNIDALNDDVEISNLPYFASFIYKGEKITFSRNLDEEEKRWLEISPNDKKAINNFFGSVRSLATLWNVTQNENLKKINMDLIKTLPNSARIYRAMKLSREDYSKKFTHPALRFALKNAMTGFNNAFFFIQVYGLFSTGDGNVPLGGAYHMIQRIKNKYLSLGGKLYLNSNVNELVVENRKVVSMKVGSQDVKADYYVSALDVNYTLKHLLKDKYKAITYSYINKKISSYDVSSCFVVYIKVDKYQDNIDTPTCVKIPKIKVGVHHIDALLVRPYAFDTTFKYGKSAVISLFADQNQDDFNHFKYLTNYEQEKERIINDLIRSFTLMYPEYANKIEVLDAFGPLELESRTNTSYGSIQSYSFTKDGTFYSFKGHLQSVSNLYMCGQWNRSIGGTPTALLTSHDMVNKIIKKDNRNNLLSKFIKSN